MIVFENVAFFQPAKGEPTRVVNLVLPTNGRVGILCRDPATQVNLSQLLAGLLPPLSGRILRHARISFPIGFNAGLVGTLTVKHNIARAARLYRADVDAVMDFVKSLARLSWHLDKPLASLPKDQQAHISTLIGYALPFDTYLFSGALGYPRGLFKQFASLYQARTKTAGSIIVTTDTQLVLSHCDIGAIFGNGKLLFYRTVEEAVISLTDPKQPVPPPTPSALTAQKLSRLELDLPNK